MAKKKMEPLWLQKELSRILLAEAHAILQCVEKLQDPRYVQGWAEVLALFQKTLHQGGKLVWVGVGKSGKIAQKIAATFCSTGSPAVFLHPTEGFHGDLGVIAPQDCVIAMSATGNTEELVQFVSYLKSQPFPPVVIGIGGNPLSQLAKHVSFWLDASIDKEACPYGLAPSTSTTLAVAIGDALALTLMQQRGFTPEDFARCHPGGVLGKRLSLRVADCMIHNWERLPVVSPDCSLQEAIEVCSEKKWGVVLVHEKKKLKGLLTDGDIRRLLQEKPMSTRFLEQPIAQFMTRRPLTAFAEERAQLALERMECRASQIGVLPVVDLKRNILGLVRVHDLIQIL